MRERYQDQDVRVTVVGSSYEIKGMFEQIEKGNKYSMKHRSETKKDRGGKKFYANAYFENNSKKRQRDKMNKQSQYRKSKPRNGARKS